MRERVNMAPVETISTTSLVESVFRTLFQSFACLSFSLHLLSSFSHFVRSRVITKPEVFSSGRGKKSFFCSALSLPVLKTMFIHWKKSSDAKLAFFVSASLVIFLYPFLAMTLYRKRYKIKQITSSKMIKPVMLCCTIRVLHVKK